MMLRCHGSQDVQLLNSMDCLAWDMAIRNDMGFAFSGMLMGFYSDLMEFYSGSMRHEWDFYSGSVGY